ncbi:MAG: hypothetical protein MJ071_02070 [Oscillospiraceae bacterium]|nr:hypothetical protein [Oscillospiraceae bacterium]
MVLTIFCSIMLLAFLGCLIATKSAYVLFAAILLFFILTGCFRRPIHFSSRRRIYVLYRFQILAVPVTEKKIGNPNEVKFYRYDLQHKNSFIALSAGEEQIVSGMTLYSYRGRPLFVFFAVPEKLHSVWQSNLFFSLAVAASLTMLAAVGVRPYLRLQHTKELMKNAVCTEIVHSPSADVIDDPVMDNILLLCRDADNGIDLMEVFSFQHSQSEVMPLYLNSNLYAELMPGEYMTLQEFGRTHTLEELTAAIETQYCILINDVVNLPYESLCRITEAAGGFAAEMTADEMQETNQWLAAHQQMLLAETERPQDGVLCQWPQICGYLHAGDNAVVQDTVQHARRVRNVTNQMIALFSDIQKGRISVDCCTETSFTEHRLYKLCEMVHSDRTHYQSAYETCTRDDNISALCVPHQGQFRTLNGDRVYTAPGIIRQYMIRLLYY